MGRDSKYCNKKTIRKAKDAQRDEANIGLLIMHTSKEKEVK